MNREWPIDIARRSSARGLQLHYTASLGFVSDSWAFLFINWQKLSSFNNV